MNHLQKHFSASLIALAALLSAAPMAAWAATAPSLGTASTFAVLSAAPNAAGAVTCTDSIINGDVGSSGLAASVTQTNCSITGAIIAPVSARVVTDFNTAQQAGMALSSNSNPLLSGSLAGVTLTPGVYNVDAVAKTGTLTLNGAGSYTFIVSATVDAVTGAASPTGALTGTNFNVVLTNGAVPCDVTWYVAQAVTMTTSGFQGTILAGAAITMTGTVAPTTSFNGDALAKAAVTLTNFTVTSCNATGGHGGKSQSKCNQGVGNGSEGCDPGNSNNNPWGSNDENGGKPGDPGRKGANHNDNDHNQK